MAALKGARGGVDIPVEDIPKVYRHLAKHYKEFNREPPPLKDVLRSLFASDNTKEREDMDEIEKLKEEIRKKDEIIEELRKELNKYKEKERAELIEKIKRLNPEANIEDKSLEELREIYTKELENYVEKSARISPRVPAATEETDEELRLKKEIEELYEKIRNKAVV